MKWEKLGNIFTPSATHEKLITHAANPLPVRIDGDVFRIFYSGRDTQCRSSVGYVDIDIVTRKTLYIHNEPALTHGEIGTFYEHGISIGNCYSANGKNYMLFMGWQNPEGGHWRGDIGRIVIGEDLSLTIDSELPLLGVSHHDPISLSYPWIEESNHGFDMWYGSTTTWEAGNGEMIHVLNHATSTDGDSWTLHGQSVPHVVGLAQAFSRPTVINNEDETQSMWFSYRSGTGEKYRIGRANSENGRIWKLALGDTGIDVSESGWDSEMIEYPFVFKHLGETYMLYNGNGYGRTGFGLAIYRD